MSGRSLNEDGEWVEPTDPSARYPRPPAPSRWVYLVILAYCSLAAIIVFGPPLLALSGGSGEGILFAFIFSISVVGIGASLLVIPVGYAWNLPRAQRSIMLPLLGSATGAAFLFAGLAIGADEFLKGNVPKEVHEATGTVLVYCVPAVWVVWLVVFGLMARSVNRPTLGRRLYRWLVAGSLLELLVAIPMHMIVRRRTECCAGLGTGIGIGTGLVVMVIALGPAVFLLFYRRYKQVYDRAHREE